MRKRGGEGRRLLSEGKSFNVKLSGNEVHCTNALLSQMKIMLCGELRCIRVLTLNTFPISFWLHSLPGMQQPPSDM